MLGVVGICCAIAGVVLLLVSIGFLWFLSFPLSIARLVCGLLGTQKVDRGELPTGRGVSQAGLVVGIVGVALHLLALIVVLLLVGLLLEAANEIEIREPDRRPDLDSPTVRAVLAAAPRLEL